MKPVQKLQAKLRTRTAGSVKRDEEKENEKFDKPCPKGHGQWHLKTHSSASLK